MLKPEINPQGFPIEQGVNVKRFAPGQKRTNVPRFTTARSLCNKTFPPLKYVVPGLVAEGLTLFAGAPKVGKSWLCMEMALAVADGGVCLGDLYCEQGDVLYLALEDNQRRLQSRINKLCPSEAPERLHLSTEWPRANEGGIDALLQWVDAHLEARLIIIDVLAMFRPSAKGKEQSAYEADYQAIKHLQGFAMDTGVAVVIVHHTRKSGSQSDPFEKVSGTLGLSGAADTTLILDRDQNGTTLYGRGRDIEEIDMLVQFDKEACRWRGLGKANEVPKSSERAEILQLLSEKVVPMSPSPIAAELGRPLNNVKQLLFKMARAGEIRRVGNGRYAHPDRDTDNPGNPGNPSNRDNLSKLDEYGNPLYPSNLDSPSFHTLISDNRGKDGGL